MALPRPNERGQTTPPPPLGPGRQGTQAPISRTRPSRSSRHTSRSCTWAVWTAWRDSRACPSCSTRHVPFPPPPIFLPGPRPVPPLTSAVRRPARTHAPLSPDIPAPVPPPYAAPARARLLPPPRGLAAPGAPPPPPRVLQRRRGRGRVPGVAPPPVCRGAGRPGACRRVGLGTAL